MKTNERLCETIGTVAIALLMALLAMIWLFFAVSACRDYESGRHRAVRPLEEQGGG